jgi:hypothetical protein
MNSRDKGGIIAPYSGRLVNLCVEGEQLQESLE